MVTDNFVTESAFFKGTSSSEKLFKLVLRLRLLEMRARWKLHVIHVTGTRMIRQGADGLPRGDMLSGVMGGLSMESFVPVHLEALGRSPLIKPWVESWWPEDQVLKWLSPNDWFSPDHKRQLRVEPSSGSGGRGPRANVQGPTEATDVYLPPLYCTPSHDLSLVQETPKSLHLPLLYPSLFRCLE